MNEKDIFYQFDHLDKKIDELNNSNKILTNKLNFLNEMIFNINYNLQDSKNYCPLCEEFSNFLPFGIINRENASCPNCRSLERSRFFYLTIKEKYSDLFNKDDVKFLHFAPEYPLYKVFREKENFNYYTADFNPDFYESEGIEIKYKVNMEDIPFIDNTFDIIYNSHVLEHVPDDHLAMSELYRVLKPNGVCFIMVPLSGNPKTLENDEYNTPELRLKFYGQEDHLRFYGSDFKGKLESVGFNVETIEVSKEYTAPIIKKVLGLFDGEIIFVCTK